MNNNILTFFISLKDQMSSGLAKVAKAAKETGSVIASAFKSSESSLDKATYKAKELADAVDKVGKRSKDSAFSLGGLMKTLGIGFSIASLVAFTKDSLAQSAQAENQRIAFKVLLGNKQSGDALYNQIRTWADTTPYESRNFMQSAKMLLGFGETRKNIMPDLHQLGDIAAAQDDPTQALWGLSHAFGEVIASGRLLGRNTLEMVNYGFNPLKEISLMTGKSMASLKKEEEQGAISAEMVRKAMIHATSEGGKFNNMMVEQSHTLSGQWSTFMDLVHAKMRSFGDTLAPAAKGLMSFATNILHLGDKSELLKFTDETAHLTGLRNELNLTNISNQRRLEIFQELKANYPSIVSNIKDEHDAIKNLLPDLQQYLNKRYLSAGVLKIKEQFSGDLSAVERANSDMQESYGSGNALASILAGKYNIDTRNLSAGQLQAKVLSQLKNKIGPKGRPVIIAGAGMVEAITEVEKDYNDLRAYINQNKAAQDLYRTHIEGANKAKQAIEQFNKVMGIDAPTEGNKGKKDNPYDDRDGSSRASDVTSGITRGGPRVINIHGVKFMDKLELHTVNLKEGTQQIEELFHDMFLRLLNSGASVQS